MSDTTQPSLLSRVRDPSNGAAWHEFDAKYKELILRYCARRGLQPSDAEDVRQIVMMNLVKALRGFNYAPQRGRFRDYLGRIARNVIFQQVQRRGEVHRPVNLAVLETLPAEDSRAADKQWEEEWVRHHYRLAMQTLRKTYEPRSVDLFDRLLDGHEVSAVADEFQMTAQAVHKVKQRIRDRLKTLIAAQIHEEDFPDG